MTTTDLGRALRRWRDAISPEAAGLIAGGHRRAAGLRREELAQLAGISVDYITRLEQGRATNPSKPVVEALSRALRLSRAERTGMFTLAGLVPPGEGTVPTFVPPGVQRILDRMTTTPVAVFDAASTQLIANPLYVALMGEHVGRERNAAWRHFAGSGSRVRHTLEELHGLRTTLAGSLRSAARRYPADQSLRELIADLRSRSDLFAQLWDSAPTHGEPLASRKTIDHPQLGPITLDCDELSVTGADLTIMVYTAEPASSHAEQLALLAVLGSQELYGSNDVGDVTNPADASGHQ